MVSGRTGTQIAFAGHNRRKQRFAQISFPGEAVQEWDLGTAGQAKKPDDKKLANACVFFPDASSDFFGVHMKKCKCRELYQGVDPAFHTWQDGKAPFGCKWFGKWSNNLDDVEDFDQVAIVVYKSGKLGDNDDGLGNSQKGELKEATSRGLPMVSVDVDELVRLIEPLSNAPETFGQMTSEEVRQHLEEVLKRDRTVRGDMEAKAVRYLDVLFQVNFLGADAVVVARQAVFAARVESRAEAEASRIIQQAKDTVEGLFEKQEQLLQENRNLAEELIMTSR